MKTALTASLRAYRFRPYAKAETAPCPSPPIKSDRTLGDSTSRDCTASHRRLADALASVLQSRVDIAHPRHATVRIWRGLPEGSLWVIHLTSLHALRDHDEADQRLHLTLGYYDLRGDNAAQYGGVVPGHRAMAWAGAVIRRCQRAAAATTGPDARDERGCRSPDGPDVPAGWRLVFRAMPDVTPADVDAFELDMQSYLTRAANVDASPSPAYSLPSSARSQSSSVFQSSPASSASPVSPDVPVRGVTHSGLPAFHDASPTIVRSKDLARYLMALNRTHAAPFVVWDIAKSWGLEPNQLASFVNRYLDPRSCYDALLNEPWRGRLVCIEDLLAWERHVAKWAQRQWNAAMWPKTFSDEHGIDTLQFADIIRSKACGVITSWVRQGRSLIDANDVPGALNVTPLERMSPPGVYWIKRTARQPRPS
ncbi:hypothetical protein PIN31115_03202 [Pandoraea iniqua]|uniref:Uncharacterized protein n=1 Tax=Pandoraea iniqua TaxID=2508288 RepID=A0A5E4WB86_9BURK|nr:hypothetical protein [Pandoraea iniqua]VVE22267.1 hypothetical protein PIN31115_03202 [Pandoraea iniqua]